MNRIARRLAVLAAFAAPALLAPAAAQATVTTATVTAPADGSAPFFDLLDGKGPYGITVSGTVNASAVATDRLDILCQRRGEALAPTPSTLQVAATSVPVVVSGASRTFSVTIDATAPALRTPCRLRAIPAGTQTSFTAAAFPAGPAVYPSLLRDLRETNIANANAGQAYDFDANTVTPGRTSAARLESFGGCGLWDARPLDPAVGPDVAALNVFDCAGWADDVASALTVAGAPTHSEVVLDTRDAFTGAMAALGSQGLPGVAGRPAMTRSVSRDPATGLLSATEGSELVRCRLIPADYPFASPSACGGFVPTGVRMERTTTMSADGRVTTMRDRWISTDGDDHVLDLDFEVDFATASAPGVVFPWVGPDVVTPAAGARTEGPPSAPGSLFVRTSSAVPDGDLARPAGAVTYSTAPNSIAFVSGTPNPSRFMQLHYQRVIGASEPLELTHSFSMAPTAAGAAALAAQAEDAFVSPAVSLSGPSVSSVPDVTVTGTATDNRGVAGLSVGGLPVAVGAGGAWSALIHLTPGANAVTARAVDAQGNAAEATINLQYVPPAAVPGTPAPAAKVPCVVPDLKGVKSPAAAVTPLRKAGCKTGKILSIYSKPKTIRKGKKLVHVVVKRFTVLGTKQKAGRKLAPGAAVDLIVQGPVPKKLTPKEQAAAKKKALARKKATAKKPKPPVYKPDVPAR